MGCEAEARGASGEVPPTCFTLPPYWLLPGGYRLYFRLVPRGSRHFLFSSASQRVKRVRSSEDDGAE
jgi:hypothetical protein